MNDYIIDPESIPLLCRTDGSAIYMTVHEIESGPERMWKLYALIGSVEPSRVTETVELVWNGRRGPAFLMHILPFRGGQFLAEIWFDPALAKPLED